MRLIVTKNARDKLASAIDVSGVNPENLLKMREDLVSVTNKILPDEKLNTIAYGCTSGTIAIGEDSIKKKILSVKPDCYVTNPITSTIKAFKLMNIKKIALFTPYPDAVNKTILEYFTKKDITVSSFASLHLNLDSEFANVDPNYILEISSTLEVKIYRETEKSQARVSHWLVHHW